MDAAERALLSETVREAVAQAAGAGTGADDVLADLGWLEMLDAEPRDAVEIVFTALGATNATATGLDDVLVSALGLEPRRDLAVLLPPFTRWAPPGRVDGDGGHAVGLATARVATAREVAVVCAAGGDLSLVTVAATDAELTPVGGVDPAAGWRTVRVTGAPGRGALVAPAAWDAAVAAGRRAIGHEVAGACRTMLDLARDHALGREQFGRPVAQFQAVRHRLAEALVAVEALEATLTAAWDVPDPVNAALAKAAAGRTARTVASHCQQVLAGIGFTTEHPFHRFLKRTMVLEGLLGSADEIVVDVGRRLLATRTVPTLIEL